MKIFDKFWIGLILSLVLPIIFGLIYFHTAYKGEQEMWTALITLARSGMSLFGKLILLSTFPNLGLFFLFYKAEYWQACRGVIVITILYFVVAFLHMS